MRELVPTLDFFLDHAATTPLSPRAREAMLPWLAELPFNASSTHTPGRRAARALAEARERMADLLGAERCEQIVFTSGGTEANNLAIAGLSGQLGPGHPVLVGATEHKSVLLPCRALARRGLLVSELACDRQGRIDCHPPPGSLVALMLANNELGTIHPIARLTGQVRLHCDAVCAAGKISIQAASLGVATLSLSAHKFYGPAGAGVLYVRQPLEPASLGGSQEHGMRPGTHNLPAIVGMVEAYAECLERLESEAVRLRSWSEQLWAGLHQRLPEVVRNSPEDGLPGLLHLSFPGVHAEALLLELDLHGVYASSGSACLAGEPGPSHVVQALGLDEELARGCLRISPGRSSSQARLNELIEVLVRAYQRLHHLRG